MQGSLDCDPDRRGDGYCDTAYNVEVSFAAAEVGIGLSGRPPPLKKGVYIVYSSQDASEIDSTKIKIPNTGQLWPSIVATAVVQYDVVSPLPSLIFSILLHVKM